MLTIQRGEMLFSLAFQQPFCKHQTARITYALILSTVHLMRLLTVATDPRESFAVGTESTSIWKATVRSDPPVPTSAPPPPLVLGGPSGRMAKPEGKRAT